MLILCIVARAVHFLRIHLVGKRIASAEAIDDANVFGKVGTTGAAVAAALQGKKVSCITVFCPFHADKTVGSVRRDARQVLLVSKTVNSSLTTSPTTC